MVAVERAEVKVNVRAHDIPKAMRALGLTAEDGKAREINFYDSDDQALSRRGLVLRTRKKAHEQESTVKVRPADPKVVDPAVARDPDFKAELEVSASATTRVVGVQLDADLPEGAIERKPIRKLFTGEQRDLARDLTGPVPWKKLERRGPIPATVWSLTDPALGAHELAAELWRLPKRRRMLELSIKCNAGEVDAVRAVLLGYLAGRGLVASQNRSSKTARALEAFGR